MDSTPLPKGLRRLLNYYSLLQFLHILFLSRAGLIFLTQGRIPFPAQPPVTGWEVETIPFLFGMGAVDALAAGLALFAGWKMVKDSEFYQNIWLISICIAATSAIIYCIGTLPSGAWQANPVGYGIVVVVFSPLVILVVQFLRFWPKIFL
jgi:hypothetical protein